jgi:hypothetical protein
VRDTSPYEQDIAGFHNKLVQKRAHLSFVEWGVALVSALLWLMDSPAFLPFDLYN